MYLKSQHEIKLNLVYFLMHFPCLTMSYSLLHAFQTNKQKQHISKIYMNKNVMLHYIFSHYVYMQSFSTVRINQSINPMNE